MNVNDYTQKLSKTKERYQDAAADLRSSFERENESVKENADIRAKKQADGYAAEKAKMEETARENNEYYTDKTKETIARRQEDYRNKINETTSKFDQEKNQMKQKYQDQLSDVKNTYQTSAKENNALHAQSKTAMNERFKKTTGELQEDYNSKVDKFSKNAQKSITNEKEADHEQRQNITASYKNELDNYRSKNQEKNFKEVARLNDDNEKLRTNFGKEREAAEEQKEARINDILKMKNAETKEGQEHFADLRKNISVKEQVDQERARESRNKETKELEHRFTEDLKTIKRLSNQKISSNGEVDGLKEDNKRLRSVYENRIQTLGKNIKEDTDRMNEKENQNVVDTKDKLSSLKSKYNEEREAYDRMRDGQKNKDIQKITEKNNNALDRYKEESQLQNKTNENHLAESKKDSKEKLKEQRVEFGKVVNKIHEKNNENIETIKGDFAKDTTKIIVKSQLDLSEEKRNLKEKLQHSLNEKDHLTEKQIDELKKDADRMAFNYESKLEHIARENEKQIEMLKATSEEKLIKHEQLANLTIDLDKQKHDLEIKNLRNRFEKVIDRDRINGEQQAGRIIQNYEDQLDRERIAHQKELSLRTNEAQAQFERLYRASELEKDTIKSQYENRIEQMKLSSLEQVNSKKA